MDDRIVIGKVVSVHGIRGEVRVYPFTDDPERFERLDEVYLLKNHVVRLVHIESVRVQKNVVILGFTEIVDRDEAEKLKDWELAIPVESLQKLPEGRYYIYQLVGMRVLTMEQRELGVLTEVLQTGANDVYVVKNSGGKEVLIPAIKSVVKQVDLEAREIWIDPIPGLLD